ncbi:hypothetical protein DICSQDRAFT_158099 [Dichomitus squalens LYAD-421 SS1]|uniref:Glycosyltransferase family 25 protein n=1 Tax=Dichomitus squalens (strain LYAD-421) TaxID=732165 RepID=R7SIE4_DICSQ|nr:uncharacterized protein DICSQDRAFT_158099 [Dichomitus squalens LYAD-421 SS1]EJF55931.1 hypothetical protein DICSQDRAFT_158099 [Dichomitus squalens LYAD-421 SS1]
MRIGHPFRQLSLIPLLAVFVLCSSAFAAYVFFALRTPGSLSRRLRLFAPSGSSSHYEDLRSGEHLSVRPLGNSHSSTLETFSRIFVISRPARLDRRAAMEQLRQSLALHWTYVDAISPDDTLVAKIGGCVRFLRRQNPHHLFEWPPDFDTLSRAPLSIQPTSSSPTPLTCAVTNHSDGVDFKPSLPAYMLLTPPKLACWYSHLTAIFRFAGEVDRSGGPALFLEDDVDMERDVGRRLEVLWPQLPSDWDIVFLGHCWSNESRYPAVGSSNFVETTVHPSFAPKCTHAYALSHTGAIRLLLHLLHPPFAYSRALDQAFSWLIQSSRLRAYSLVPSVVVQRRADKSDIDGGQDGLGSRWQDHLQHGVLSL